MQSGDILVDVCVRGSGVVAHTLALALSRQGLSVALQGRAAPPRTQDVRAYALNAASVALLQSLKIWDALPADARTPVYDMQVQGDAAALLRFSAWQQHARELAWIVDTAALEQELAAALRYAPHVALAQGETAPPATLTVLAEGRASATREELGVPFQMHDYGQRAIAARLVSDQAHAGLARQWFRAPDVLALLPLDRPQPGHGLALVWSLPDERAKQLLAQSETEFEAALAQATGGAAGTLRLASERASWPLVLARAERVHGPGWVLVGDAAHVVHPLAGQGLNLGLGDVQALTAVLAGREAWRALGDVRLLERYARERALPVQAMATLTDGLLRLFSRPEPWARELRNRGLALVDSATAVKRWLGARALGQ